MNATLYIPEQSPITAGELERPEVSNGFAQVPAQVAVLLGCTPDLVDVLAVGPDYVVYSVFDSEAAVNNRAMKAVSELSGVYFGPDDEDSLLRGPVLTMTEL